MSAKRQRDLNTKKEDISMYQYDREKKKQAVKKRYDSKKESMKQCEKEKCVKNRTLNISFKKARYQESPDLQL